MSDLLHPGQLFAGRYRIEKFLAKGGYGAVYVAEQTETELRVALKVLWPHVLHSTDTVEKFKLEARIAGRVDSEHIVQVFDTGFDDATRMPFLVMELLRGVDLESMVESSGALPSDRLVQYFRQIASALDKAHGYVDRHGARRPIVHRDLKPQNLFLNYRETGEPIVKILDFGIAKVLSDSTNISQEVKGTPLYMAFEQASAGLITSRTDIWALGLIAFFLLTGRCYWKTAHLRESSVTQLFGEILSLPIDPPSTRAAQIGAAVIPSSGFDAWFARCVDRDPGHRFATAGEAAAALASVFEAPDTHPSPGFFRPEAFLATAASAPELSGTGPLLALGNTAAPRGKTRAPLAGIAGAVLLALGGLGIVNYLSKTGSPAASSSVTETVPRSSVSVSTPAVAMPPGGAGLSHVPVPSVSAVEADAGAARAHRERPRSDHVIENHPRIARPRQSLPSPPPPNTDRPAPPPLLPR